MNQHVAPRFFNNFPLIFSSCGITIISSIRCMGICSLIKRNSYTSKTFNDCLAAKGNGLRGHLKHAAPNRPNRTQ